jgi:hypothetical protein
MTILPRELRDMVYDHLPNNAILHRTADYVAPEIRGKCNWWEYYFNRQFTHAMVLSEIFQRMARFMSEAPLCYPKSPEESDIFATAHSPRFGLPFPALYF